MTSYEKKITRPVKPIDWQKVDQLLLAGCTGTEIAPHFDMHEDTFYKRVEDQYGMGFTAYCSLKRCQGDSILRAKQFEQAIKGDKTMLVWLGKNRLNQRESPEQKAIDPQELVRFMAMMKQLTEAQSFALNDADTTMRIDNKS